MVAAVGHAAANTEVRSTTLGMSNNLNINNIARGTNNSLKKVI